MAIIKQIQRDLIKTPKIFAKHVGIYARVSTNHIRQFHSMADQISALTKYVFSQSNWVLTDVYMDFDNASGKKVRKNFYRMIDDAKAGQLVITGP